MPDSMKLDDIFGQELAGLHCGPIKDETDLIGRAERNGRSNKVSRCLLLAWWLTKSPDKECSAQDFANGLWDVNTDEYTDAINFFRSKTKNFTEKKGPPYQLSPVELASVVSERAIIVGYLFLCFSDAEQENGQHVLQILGKLKISKRPPLPNRGLSLQFLELAGGEDSLEVEQVREKQKAEVTTEETEAGSVTVKNEKTGKKNWRKRWLWATAILVGLSASAFVVNRLDPALILEISAANGATAAKAFATTSVFDPAKSEEFIYNLGFTYYRNLEHEQARKNGYKLLSSPHATAKSRGKACYLLALTYAKSEPEKALPFLEQAREELESAQQWHRLYLTEVERAKAFILVESFVHAQQSIDESFLFFKKSGVKNKHITRWYGAKCKLERALGSCENLLKYAESGYLEIPRNQNDDLEATFLSELSLAHILMGNTETGEFFSDAAQKIAEGLDDQRNEAFIKCNYLLIKIRNGEDYQALEDEIQNWAEQHHDTELLNHLKTVLHLECSTP